MDLELKDQVVVITGGASGIGLATAKGFVSEGAVVAIWDASSSLSADEANWAESSQGKVLFITANITQESEVRNAFEKTMKTFGRIDHLVHAAAIGSGKFGFPYTNLQPADWAKVIEVNIMGMVQVAHLIGPQMRKQLSGTMAFIGSVAGQIGSQTDPPYSASKAANINFAQCMARDLAPFHVRVNVVNPGMVQTPLNRSVWQAWYDQQPEGTRKSYEEWGGEKVDKVVPLGRWQTPEDVANLVIFLASNKARNITGQNVNVDGGFVMHW